MVSISSVNVKIFCTAFECNLNNTFQVTLHVINQCVNSIYMYAQLKCTQINQGNQSTNACTQTDKTVEHHEIKEMPKIPQLNNSN